MTNVTYPLPCQWPARGRYAGSAEKATGGDA